MGNLAPTVTEDEFKRYFELFGNITDVVVMYDHISRRPSGFGFITFDSEKAMDKVVMKNFHELHENILGPRPRSYITAAFLCTPLFLFPCIALFSST